MAEAALVIEQPGAAGAHRVQRHARTAADRPLPTDTGDDTAAHLKKVQTAVEAENARLRGDLTQATETANAARAAVAEVKTAQISDREIAIRSAATAAASAVESAKIAWRSARESGNIEAEAAANDALTDAKVDLKYWNLQKQEFDSGKAQMLEDAKRVAEPVSPNTGPTAAAKQWMADHPKFNSDMGYQRETIYAQGEAAKRGFAGGSQESLDFIERHLTREFGKDHGKEPGTMRDRDDRSDRSAGRVPSSMDAAPPGRATDTAFSSGAADLRLERNSKGEEILRGTIPANWVEAASWCGYEDKPGEAAGSGVVRYAIEQLKIEEEEAAGRPAYHRDGNVGIYR